jgi:hypothetical protein
LIYGAGKSNKRARNRDPRAPFIGQVVHDKVAVPNSAVNPHVTGWTLTAQSIEILYRTISNCLLTEPLLSTNSGHDVRARVGRSEKGAS